MPDPKPHNPSAWWFRLPAAFVDHDLAAFESLGALKVELALRRHADAGGLAFPSISELSRKLNLDRSNVSRAIKWLVDAGRIERLAPGSRAGESTRYRIVQPAPSAAEGGAVVETQHGGGPDATPLAAHTQHGGGSHATPVAAQTHGGSGPDAAGVAAQTHGGSGPDAALNRDREIETENKTQEQTQASAVPPAGKASKRKAVGKPLPVLPPDLDTPSFRPVWAEWVQHRREIRKPLTPTAVRQQLADLVAWGEQRAVAALRHSIANGWAGVFEPKHPAGASHGQRSTYGRPHGGTRLVEQPVLVPLAG